jgi:hypothetical protein
MKGREDAGDEGKDATFKDVERAPDIRRANPRRSIL